MRTLATLVTGLLFATNLFAQQDKLKELIDQGIQLHDQGKYNEAIEKYKAALQIDSKSSLANYELSFSYFLNQQHDSAIKYSRTAIQLNSGNEQESYIVLGNSLDVTGHPGAAIKTYEEGLAKFPNSNLLHYNLALTTYNQKDYKKAETAAIEAITAKREHASSHLILAAVMQATGQRVKSILPLYYFLLLEPDSKRSLPNYNFLKKQLGLGVEKKDEKNINISIPSSKDDDFGAAEMMVGLLAASRFTEENKNKTEMDLFADTNKGIFSVLGELKKDNKGIWWDLYVTKFYELVQSENHEAYSYYISQSTNSDEVNKWIGSNSEKMNKLREWMKK